MSEEEIIERVNFVITNKGCTYTEKDYIAIECLLDLYNKQKEENERIKKEFVEEKLYKDFYKDLTEKWETLAKSLSEKNVSLKKEISLMKSVNINNDFISKDKIKEILDLAYKDNYEMVKLPNNDFMCVSDCENLLDYLKELVEEK